MHPYKLLVVLAALSTPALAGDLPEPVLPQGVGVNIHDHGKSKTWSVEKTTWLPWKWGDQDRFRDSAEFHAQQLVESAARSDENITSAKARTELVLRKSYELVQWTVQVEWQ